MQTKKREIVPIQHNVDNGNMLQDKVAVIIGGSGGIGLSIAKSFYESGCKIVLCGTNEKKLKKCIDEFPETNRIRYMVFDVSDFEKIEDNVQRLIMPDEGANVAKMLVSSAGNMIVGETIHISGGRGICDIR